MFILAIEHVGRSIASQPDFLMTGWRDHKNMREESLEWEFGMRNSNPTERESNRTAAGGSSTHFQGIYLSAKRRHSTVDSNRFHSIITWGSFAIYALAF